MWRSAVTFLGTILVLVALAVLPLLTPPFVHAGTDLAGAAGALGIDPATTTLTDTTGRPQHLVDAGEVLREVL